MNGADFFPAPWGRALKVISTLATLFLVAATGAGWWAEGLPSLGRWSLFVAPLGLLAGCLLFVVRGYRPTPSALYVRRLLWETRVPLDGLHTARLEPGAPSKVLRVCGNGGLFSFSGWFWSRSLGRFRLFANDLRQPVVLRFADRAVVVHPARPEAFVERLRQLTGAAGA